jgi:hypothetical protein
MIRRQSELEGEQRRLGEHGSHATHHSLYQQRRRTWRPSRKVHRLLQCLDELEVSWACERASWALRWRWTAASRAVEVSPVQYASSSLLGSFIHTYIIILAFAFSLSPFHI